MDKLHDAIVEIVAIPEVQAKFAKVGIMAHASTPGELMNRLKVDIAKWNVVIQNAGIPKK